MEIIMVSYVKCKSINKFLNDNKEKIEDLFIIFVFLFLILTYSIIGSN